MDPEDLRSVLKTTGVDLWTLIETSIAFAAAERGRELKARRDGIVERLYSLTDGRCQNCDEKMAASRSKGSSSPAGKRCPSKGKEEEVEEHEEEDEGEERNYRAVDDEQSKILAIKDFLDDPDQSEDSLLSLLQNLADMDITFKALKETDIGRHVNGLRKHPSSEVKRLVKQLVRKWKETVDEWVKLNSANDISSPAIITDGDSPQQMPAKNNQNGHQTPDLTYSPNLHGQNGSWQTDRNSLESIEHKARQAPRREAPPKPINSIPSAAIAKEKKKDDGYSPDLYLYSALIECLSENLQLKDAVEMLEEMSDSGITPSASIYVPIMNGYCKLGNFHEAMEIHYGINNGLFEPHDALLNRFCDLDRFPKAINLLEEMLDLFKQESVQVMCLDLRSYSELIKRLFHAKEVQDAATKGHNIKGYDRVETLKQDRVENLRKLDELRDQIKQSCEIVEIPKERVTVNMSSTLRSHGHNGRCSWFPDGFPTLNRKASQPSSLANEPKRSILVVSAFIGCSPSLSGACVYFYEALYIQDQLQFNTYAEVVSFSRQNWVFDPGGNISLIVARQNNHEF